LGRVEYVNHPDSGETTMAYDDASNAIRTVDARGKETLVAYDEANRRLRTWDPADEAGTFIEWRYDGAGGCDASVCTHTPGQLTEVTYPLLDGKRGAELFGFDVRGRGVRRQYVRGEHAFDFA